MMPSRPIIAATCLVVGVASGWVARPLLSPPTLSVASVTAPASAQAALPDQQEATEAVRRRPTGISSLAHAGVTLGSCESQGGLARCAIELIWDDRHPGTPQHRVVTFGRIAGRWEVALSRGRRATRLPRRSTVKKIGDRRSHVAFRWTPALDDLVERGDLARGAFAVGYCAQIARHRL